jgi:hypothetical protein
MPHDIDTIKKRVRALVPNLEIEQLRVRHKADDDGLWFFRSAEKKEELQLESSTYNLPFHIETDASNERRVVMTVDEAVEVIRTFFSQPKA